MLTSRLRRVARLVAALQVAALVVPVTALSAIEPPRNTEGTGSGRGGGGLAGTGFDVWQVALVGVALVAVAMLLMRRAARDRR